MKTICARQALLFEYIFILSLRELREYHWVYIKKIKINFKIGD